MLRFVDRLNQDDLALHLNGRALENGSFGEDNEKQIELDLSPHLVNEGLNTLAASFKKEHSEVQNLVVLSRLRLFVCYAQLSALKPTECP